MNSFSGHSESSCPHSLIYRTSSPLSENCPKYCHKAKNVNTTTLYRRYSKLLISLLPSVGNTGLLRKSCFIKVEQIDKAFLFRYLGAPQSLLAKLKILLVSLMPTRQSSAFIDQPDFFLPYASAFSMMLFCLSRLPILLARRIFVEVLLLSIRLDVASLHCHRWAGHHHHVLCRVHEFLIVPSRLSIATRSDTEPRRCH